MCVWKGPHEAAEWASTEEAKAGVGEQGGALQVRALGGLEP